MKKTRDPLPPALFAIFTLSGFSGLIYESVWTHYLKLFLGHAAYAQTLVLGIFMGGLAAGAWLASRWSARWARPLIAYALIEALIGLAGLGFNRTFQAFTAFSYESVLPWLENPAAIQAYKWGTAALVILPQTVLLGMTFPLMSVGLIRHRPATPGSHVSMLYFTNSIGAAAGVLTSGFVLIPEVGLPGAIMTAGLLNVLIGLSTWLVARPLETVAPPPIAARKSVEGEQGQGNYDLLLIAALVTGFASFFYEIGWIRMLTLVLGASTHAFELMLSAFILGLAFGGLWIRRRIDALSDSMRTLGIVQVVMALLALSTLFAYGWTFDMMGEALGMFSRSASGYLGFNASSHLIAVLIMVPTTFCAGMTLPLLTYTALRRGIGERAVGGIYAANTLGAILGVAAAVHLVMPAVGTKGVIVAGALFDFLLGLWLLAGQRDRRPLVLALAVGLAGFGLSLVVANFDPQRLVSGVYRFGKPRYEGAEVLFHHDGKTATVSVIREGTRIFIATNGKADASIDTAPGGKPAMDEITQNMLGSLPLALHPRAKTAAVIGFGSGMTSAVMLSHPQLERVETIEIEPLMVTGARLGMMPRNRAVFEDPRSTIHIEDAKTFLSTQGRRYDIIVSEPSNPWVSGVASLFTEEFYRHAQRNLEQDGILVQWIQLYEIDMTLVTSIMRAMTVVFDDYAVFDVDHSNILVVARKGRGVGNPSPHVFDAPALRAELRRIGILNAADIAERRIGGKRLLDPLFRAQGAPANSDYFPFVDVNAVRARFMRADAQEFAELAMSELPIREMLEGKATTVAAPVARERFDTALQKAELVRHALLAGATDVLPTQVSQDADYLLYAAAGCPSRRFGRDWETAFLRVLAPLAGRLDKAAMAPVWDRLAPARCRSTMMAGQSRALSLLKAISDRDAAGMDDAAAAMLADRHAGFDVSRVHYLMGVIALGRLAAGRAAEAQAALEQYAALQKGKAHLPLQLQWLHAIALDRTRPAQRPIGAPTRP